MPNENPLLIGMRELSEARDRDAVSHPDSNGGGGDPNDSSPVYAEE
ncbi:MAG TPA: hypothetical protein VEU30_01925 [Thermoanaerobaculia bacterium]|nr:hypothetical protein [Thermoanaerobaculia bacterium]